MRNFSCLLFALFLFAACSAKKLVRRLPGTWYMEHYDEYLTATDSSTGHDLDGAGVITFSKGGRINRKLYPSRPHGSLINFSDYRWQLKDSLISITGPGGLVLEEWLVTKDLTDYLELVSVNAARDSVRTMYLRK